MNQLRQSQWMRHQMVQQPKKYEDVTVLAKTNLLGVGLFFIRDSFLYFI
jgi:hypothetical protein